MRVNEVEGGRAGRGHAMTSPALSFFLAFFLARIRVVSGESPVDVLIIRQGRWQPPPTPPPARPYRPAPNG